MKRTIARFSTKGKLYEANKVIIMNGRTTFLGNVTVDGVLYTGNGKTGERYDRAGIPTQISTLRGNS